jgi:hypothetical protein
MGGYLDKIFAKWAAERANGCARSMDPISD